MEIQSRDGDNVAPILNYDKATVFGLGLVETILGYKFSQPHGAHSSGILPTILNVVFAAPAVFLWLFSFLFKEYVTGAIVATVVTTVMIVVWVLVEHFIIDRAEIKEGKAQSNAQLVVKCILAPISSFLAFNHFHSCQNSLYLSVVSFITLHGSLTSLYSKAVRQFGTMTENYYVLSLRSTYLVRIYLCDCVLTVETVLFYLYPKSSILTVFQHIYCLMFGLWWLGILTDITSLITIVANWINEVVFGEQKKVGLGRVVISLVLNAAIALGFVVEYIPDYSHYFTLVNSVMLGTSLITSTSLLNSVCWFRQNREVVKNSHFLEYVLEGILLAGKVVLTVLIPAVTQERLLIVLGVDLGVYLLVVLVFNLSQGRTFVGSFQLFALSPNLKTLLRWVVRSSADICFVFLSKHLYDSAPLNSFYLTFVFRILLYRSYKRAIYQPLSFGLHLSFALSMILANVLAMWIIPLAMIPLPNNPFLTLISPFIIPKKNIHSHESLYRIFYLLLTAIGYCVVTASLGLLEPLMLFGMPAFLWSLPPATDLSKNGHGKDKSIHQHLVVHLSNVIQGYEVGTYLLRVSKYLVLCRVVEKGIGYQIAEFRGLEAQQVTTCHGIQAQTVDNMVEETWGDKKECQLDHYIKVLSPLAKHDYTLFEANEISLAGIIDSKEFAAQLKKNYLKILLYVMHKEEYMKEYRSEIVQTARDIHDLVSKQELEGMEPREFSLELGIPLKEAKKTLLAPIPKKQVSKPNPPQAIPAKSIPIFDQFDFMMEKQTNSQRVPDSSTNSVMGMPKEESSINLLTSQEGPTFKRSMMLEMSRQNSEPEDLTACLLECAAALCIYSLSRNTFLDQKRLFQLLSSEKLCEKILKNVNLKPKGELCLKSIRYAFRLTVEQTINSEDTTTLRDIEEIISPNSYIGVLGEEKFERAVEDKVDSIWCIDYSDGVKINRYSERVVELYSFRLDQAVVRGIWNNLRFQLLYVTNDDDERYSIQTHPMLLRNLLVEGAVEPLGYAPYYTGYQVL